MKIINIIKFTLIIILLNSCKEKTLKDKFNLNDNSKNLEMFYKNKLITADEKDLLFDYTSNITSNNSITTFSYEDLLISAKEKRENNKKIKEALTINVIRKYLENAYDEGYIKTFFYIDIAVKNNTDKKISRFTFTLNFINSDGLVFFTSNWPVAKTIKPKSKLNIILSTGEYKNTNIDQAKLKIADLSKVKVNYEVSELSYDDGTSQILK